MQLPGTHSGVSLSSQGTLLSVPQPLSGLSTRDSSVISATKRCPTLCSGETLDRPVITAMLQPGASNKYRFPNGAHNSCQSYPANFRHKRWPELRAECWCHNMRFGAMQQTDGNSASTCSKLAHPYSHTPLLPAALTPSLVGSHCKFLEKNNPSGAQSVEK